MPELNFHSRPLIGMIHLPPLPGAPRYGGSMEAVFDHALRDAEALSTAGLDAVLVENFGDVPFPVGAAPPETVAALAAVTDRVGRSIDLPVGVNVLRNDGRSALAVAAAASGDFIRVNVLAWARLTDQGLIEGRAAELMRQRAALGAEHVLVLADVSVKHSAPLAEVPIAREAQDLVERALADAIVVTGEATSGAVDLDSLEQVVRAVDVPVLVGSGVTPRTASHVLGKGCGGAIVGTALMVEGRPGGAIDLDRATRLVAAWRDE